MRKFLLFIIISCFVLMLPWIIITSTTYSLVYRDVGTIPEENVGLILGTTPGVDGQNLFFSTRIEAAKELYERGKIHHILVS